MKNSKRILSISIVRMIDTDADTSYLDQSEPGCDFSRRKAEYEAGRLSFHRH